MFSNGFEMAAKNLFNSDERKRKLALALLIMESSDSDDSTDDEVLQMLIKEKIFRPKHKKRQSLMQSYTEDDVWNSYFSLK